MPNKNKCSKCGNKHYPPTGKKCAVWLEAVEEEENTSASHKGSSTVPSEPMTTGNSFKKHKSADAFKDSSTVPGTSMGQGNSSVKQKSPMGDLELSSEEQDTVSLQILRQLKRVNDSVDAVEEKVAKVVTGDSCVQPKKWQKVK